MPSSFRLGSDASGWVDLPVATDIVPSPTKVGGEFRGLTGQLNSDRVAVKYGWSIPLRPWLNQEAWSDLLGMYEESEGPYFFLDSTRPNMLPLLKVQGVGLKAAGGGAIPSVPNMRSTLSATFTTVQTAKSATPDLADLLAVSQSTAYTAGVTINNQGSFSGALEVYGYVAASGTGVLLGSVALAATGRYKVSVASATYNYLALRAVRYAGTAQVYDWVVNQGFRDHGPNIRQVVISDLPRTAHIADSRKSTLSLSLTEV